MGKLSEEAMKIIIKEKYHLIFEELSKLRHRGRIMS